MYFQVKSNWLDIEIKRQLIEHIRNRNSTFAGLVYTSAYWLRWCIRFHDSGKKNKDIKNVVLFNNIISLSGILIRLHSMLQCNGFFFTKTEGHLGIFKNWLLWLRWNEIIILQMFSSVAINYSYYSCFQPQVISFNPSRPMHFRKLYWNKN